MGYKLVEHQILNMKCQKIYKPILLLSYLDYLEIMDKTLMDGDLQVSMHSLLPLIKYYLKSTVLADSKYGLNNIDNTSNEDLMKILINGPLFRIQNEVSIFNAYETNGNFMFGIDTDNDSINLNQLTSVIRSACNQLICNLLGKDLKPLHLTLYKEMVHEIKTTKIDLKGHPKIYKYLVILSYIDYFADLELEDSCFKTLVPVEELFTYYKLYFNIPEFGDNISTPAIKEGSDSYVLRHMRVMPIRKLCKPNTFFKCIQLDQNSRTLQNLPTQFGIIIEDSTICNEIMIRVIRDCVLKVIQERTKKIINTNLTLEIKYSQDVKTTSVARYGQNQYRKSLLEKYNCTCALCNMDLDFVLVASHAMPWRDCTSTHQRLSPNNGLLLCEYHDSLFDKGLITFDRDSNYEVIFSDKMTETSIEHFFSFYDNKILNYVSQNSKLGDYLDYHKNNVFKV